MGPYMVDHIIRVLAKFHLTLECHLLPIRDDSDCPAVCLINYGSSAVRYIKAVIGAQFGKGIILCSADTLSYPPRSVTTKASVTMSAIFFFILPPIYDSVHTFIWLSYRKYKI
jgi:hypothetical protein